MSVPGGDGGELDRSVSSEPAEPSAPAATDPGDEQRRAAGVPVPDATGVGGGVQVARLFGVPILVQPGWLLVAAALLTYVVQPRAAEYVTGPASYLLALSFAVLLYVSVLIHELSHSVVALRLGMRVRRISLQLLGGVSEIEEEAQTPGREFAIAFAGPALSFVVYGAATVVYLGLPQESVAWWLVYAVAKANLVVGVFNLLPGLPLDGGRVLQAAVWRGTGNRHTGVIAAAWGGRILAVGLLILAPALMLAGAPVDLLSVAWSGLIAAFLWTGAGASLRAARFRARLPDLQARLLARRAVAVSVDTTVEAALSQATADGAAGIVVLDGSGAPYALVSEPAVRAMPEDRRSHVPVADLARRLEPGLILPADSVGEEVLRPLNATPATEYLLLEPDGRVAGVLLAEDVEHATAGW